MSDRVVIVTGGFGTLGRAVAAAFAAEGAKVARVDFAPAPADAGDLDIGGVDLTDAAAAAAAAAKVRDVLGTPSVLANVAGGFIWQTLDDGGPATWERMFRMNALTAVTMTKATLPLLLEKPGASIISIGAGAAARAAAGMGAYAASKAAVARLTESLAEELAARDITINCILPSIIDTPANRADMPDADTSAWVKPEAIADVIRFLASPAARSITGASIPVTRGTGG